jgi:hypothetical protein
MTTGYGLDGQGSIPGRGKTRPGLRPIQSPIQSVLAAFSPGVKRPGSEADHTSPSSAEVKNGVAIPLFCHTSSWRGA